MSHSNAQVMNQRWTIPLRLPRTGLYARIRDLAAGSPDESIDASNTMLDIKVKIAAILVVLTLATLDIALAG